MKDDTVERKRPGSPFHTLRRRLVQAFLAGMAVSGCSTGTTDSGTRTRSSGSFRLPPAVLGARYALFGELHDNPAAHRLRLEWLRELSARRRVAIAMEQFDVGMQAQLEAAQASRRSLQSARELARRADFSFQGWDWSLYEPVIELALARGLPLVAANLPAADAMAAGRAPDAQEALRPPGWSAKDAGALAAVIDAGHCGLLPATAIGQLVLAQMARDRTMARAMTAAHRQLRLPVVLLAGNGHVRADIGVPRYLAGLDPGAAVVSIAVAEEGAPVTGHFDHVVTTVPADRPDPCQALRERFGAPGR